MRDIKEGLKRTASIYEPMDLENSEPNYWLSCLIINKEAMCKQVRGEQDVCYVKETGKSCPTEILEAIASINAEGVQFGNQCICSRFIV